MAVTRVQQITRYPETDMHQFNIGDRALCLPEPGETDPCSGKLCTIISELYSFCGVMVHDIDVDDLAPPCPGVPWDSRPEYLMPLPKRGPDAEQDLARKLVEMHGGCDG